MKNLKTNVGSFATAKLQAVSLWLIAIIALAFSALLLTGCPAEPDSEPADPGGHIHNWGEWTVTIEPNKITDGSEERVCKLDSSHIETRRIPRTGTGSTVPEQYTGVNEEERYTKQIDTPKTATLEYEVASDGVCTITVGGTPYPHQEGQWYRWKANVHYYYTAKANTSYKYTFEAWTQSGTRNLGIQYYYDFDTGEYLNGNDIPINSTRQQFTVIGAAIPKGGIRSLQFHCGDKIGTFYVKVISITEYELENLPVAERWWTLRDPSSTATLDHFSVAGDGRVTITTGGRPEPEGVNNIWRAWTITAAYEYTSKANTAYKYVIEASKQGTGERLMHVQYYQDNDDAIYFNDTFTLTNTPTRYTVYGRELPKQGKPVSFLCADYTGTFYLKIISIETYEIGELTITNFRGTPGLRSDKWTMGDAHFSRSGGEKYIRFNQHDDAFEVPASGNSISVSVFNAEQRNDYSLERTTPFIETVTVEAGNLRIDQWGGTTPDTHYVNKVPITFTRGNATINFGQQMVKEEDFEYSGGGDIPSLGGGGEPGGGNIPPGNTPGGGTNPGGGGDPNAPYIITGSGGQFTATKSGVTVGTANQPISSVVYAIRTHAAGQDYTLQFGNGTDVLDIGTEGVLLYLFENDPQCTITLTGKITSRSGSYAIANSNVSIVSTADIANTGTGLAINNSSGNNSTMTINGGMITTTGGIAIGGGNTITINNGTILVTGDGAAVGDNNTNSTITINGGTITVTGNGIPIVSFGTVTINNGTISATGGGNAIYCSSTLTINGGTISATGTGGGISGNTVTITGGTISVPGRISGRDITIDDGTVTGGVQYNSSDATGTLTINGGMIIITSTINNPTAGSTVTINGGTISITGSAVTEHYGIGNAGTLIITGGTLSVTGGTDTNIAVSNSGGTVSITGGTISATGGSYSHYAVFNNSGRVSITGGTLSATGGNFTYAVNTANGTVSITNGTLSATGGSQYNFAVFNNNSSVSITSPPAVITGEIYRLQ